MPTRAGETEVHSSLLEPGFVRELEALRRHLETRARAGMGGEHAARRRGGSAEFLEHRPYHSGDDLRRIDWLAFARTGEPFFKLFRAEEDTVVRIVVDASLSLDAGTPHKLTAAKRFAAAASFLALAASERTQIVTASEGLHHTTAPIRGRGALLTVLRQLEAITPRGGTDLARVVTDVVRRDSRPGMLVLVSDFLDAHPFDTAIARASSMGHDIILVQIASPDELDPTFEGDLALEDAETGEVVELTVDAAALDVYRRRLEALFAHLRRLATRHGGAYVRMRSDEPIRSAIRRFVARGRD